uniref:Uncharacterized protein n=1 Tax=Cacopsylla melanoneura TaxID=428564 RepID=A0A8D8USB2_9HEMI
MEKICIMIIAFLSSIALVKGQTSTPSTAAHLDEFLQKNPSFQTFLNGQPAIRQLLQSVPALVTQFELNPSLINQTEEHASFLNSFLRDHTNLSQIIKDNPYVFAFILKQVDHAVATGQNSTIVIQMSDVDIQEAQKELDMAAHHGGSGQQQGSNVVQTGSGNQATTPLGDAQKNVNALAELTKEQLLALLMSQQSSSGIQTQTLQIPNKLPPVNENMFLHQTSQPQQQADVIGQKQASLIRNQSLHNPVNPEKNFGFFYAQNTQMKPNLSGASATNDNGLIDIHNLSDLNKLKMLYLVMYNREPNSVPDLLEFYNTILVKLDIRTRKQVTDFLARFKTVHSNQAGQISNSYQPKPVGVLYQAKPLGTVYQAKQVSGGNSDGTSGNKVYTVISNLLGYGVSSTTPKTKPAKMSCRERILQRKLDKYCRQNPSSPRCNQQQVIQLE